MDTDSKKLIRLKDKTPFFFSCSVILGFDQIRYKIASFFLLIGRRNDCLFYSGFGYLDNDRLGTLFVSRLCLVFVDKYDT